MDNAVKVFCLILAVWSTIVMKVNSERELPAQPTPPDGSPLVENKEKPIDIQKGLDNFNGKYPKRKRLVKVKHTHKTHMEDLIQVAEQSEVKFNEIKRKHKKAFQKLEKKGKLSAKLRKSLPKQPKDEIDQDGFEFTDLRGRDKGKGKQKKRNRKKGRGGSKRPRKKPGKRSKRSSMVKDEYYGWDDAIIPFRYGANNSEEQALLYDQAMTLYEHHTCMRFVDHDNTTKEDFGLTHDNYVNFLPDISSGCWSYIGNIRHWTGQSIACGCSLETCWHELGHAIGLYHEHRNPNRDMEMRMDFTSVTGAWRHNIEMIDAKEILQDSFDFSSSMMYNFWFDFMAPLDSRDELLPRLHHEFFYMFKSISEHYDCAGLRCDDGNPYPTCYNDGYFSVLEDVCQCICPKAFDPDTDCQTAYNGDDSLKTTEWPEGPFAMLKPSGGCPDASMAVGSSVQTSVSAITTSDRYTVAGTFSGGMLALEYCTNQQGSPNVTWPIGVYCILKVDASCPEDFTVGSISLSDASQPTVEGTIPEILLTTGSTTFTFCCRNDGSYRNHVSLPTSSPFILYQIDKDHCQNIKDMTGTKQSYKFTTADSTGITVSGLHPDLTVDGASAYVNLCYYEPIIYDYSEMHVLSAANNLVTIQSPNHPSNYGDNRELYWIFKAPEGSHMILNFTHFDLEGEPGACFDWIEIRDFYPGQPGYSFCGDEFKPSVTTRHNTLTVIMKSDYLTGHSGFQATVNLIQPSNMCYNVEDQGASYRGNINFTIDYTDCIPWTAANKMCRHHSFHPNDLNAGLDGNHCRNPGHGHVPWCYTDATTCARQYCDVCQKGKCYDISDTCAPQMASDPQYCSDMSNAYYCFHSCGLCPLAADLVQTIDELSCSPPEVPSDAVLVGLDKSSYAVGESVTLACSSNQDVTVKSVCQSDMSWSLINYVCGGCPYGWLRFESSCYKYMTDWELLADAKLACSNLQANLYHPVTAEEQSFMAVISDDDPPIWIGQIQNDGSGNLSWEDGSAVEGINTWAEGEPGSWDVGSHCVQMAQKDEGYNWSEEDSVYCQYWTRLPFICEKGLTTAREVCADQISTCQQLLHGDSAACAQFKSFAEQACPKSCGTCGTPTVCELPTTPSNAALDTTVNGPITAGQFIEYSCAEGYTKNSGNIQRACLLDGTFTGTPLECLDESTQPVTSSDVPIISRSYPIWEWWGYTANSDNMRIKTDGVLIAWEFYTDGPGDLMLRVIRVLSTGTGGTLDAQLLTTTVFTALNGDTSHTYILPPEEQIPVMAGDLIMVDLDENANVIKYDWCDKTQHPEAADFLYGWFWGTTAGETWTFEPLADCMFISVRAVIQPV